MKYNYRCDACGCYLDPGEGLLCDECKAKIRLIIAQTTRYEQLLSMDDRGQYQMKVNRGSISNEL